MLSSASGRELTHQAAKRHQRVINLPKKSALFDRVMARIPIEHVHPGLPEGTLGRCRSLHDRQLVVALNRWRSASISLLYFSHDWKESLLRDRQSGRWVLIVNNGPTICVRSRLLSTG